MIIRFPIENSENFIEKECNIGDGIKFNGIKGRFEFIGIIEKIDFENEIITVNGPGYKGEIYFKQVRDIISNISDMIYSDQLLTGEV